MSGLVAGLAMLAALLLGAVVLTATPGPATAGQGRRLASTSTPDPELLRIERTLQKIERLRDRRDRLERAERWRDPPPPHPSQPGDKPHR
ncbi:MAG: hypothetical protein HYY85_02380 [Deltaproteobacteria bacterium]|nr:hypothetical protein [Deltaproteobacteria bacterium]